MKAAPPPSARTARRPRWSPQTWIPGRGRGASKLYSTLRTHMNIYIYIYYIYIYNIHIYICIHICICIYIYIYIHIRLSLSLYIYICFVFIHVYIYIYTYYNIYIYIYIYTYIHTHVYVLIRNHTCMLTWLRKMSGSQDEAEEPRHLLDGINGYRDDSMINGRGALFLLYYYYPA